MFILIFKALCVVSGIENIVLISNVFVFNLISRVNLLCKINW